MSPQHSQYVLCTIDNVPVQPRWALGSHDNFLQQCKLQQPTVTEAFSTHFGNPQYRYVVFDEWASISALAAGMEAHDMLLDYPPPSYTVQNPIAWDPLAATYACGMNHPIQGSSHGICAGGDCLQTQLRPDFNYAYTGYQMQVKKTFECILDGRLGEGGGYLLSITKWLLGNIEALVLHLDDESVHVGRLKLWEEFNSAWLGILQKQQDMALGMALSEQVPRPPQSLMEYNSLECMGKELVAFCDLIEKYGLVDYQMGVWEEEIIATLAKTLDVMEKHSFLREGDKAHESATT